MALELTESQPCARAAIMGILLEIILIFFTWEVQLYLHFLAVAFFKLHNVPQWYVTCILVLVILICIQGLAKLPPEIMSKARTSEFPSLFFFSCVMEVAVENATNMLFLSV